MSDNGSKRLLVYAAAVVALVAIALYLRSGRDDAGSSPAADKTQPATARRATPSPTRGHATAGNEGQGRTPPPAADDSPSDPDDGSDIVVPKNEFGQDLPPPPTPSKDDKIAPRPKRKPLTAEDKQESRRLVVDLLRRRIDALEKQAKTAAAGGDEKTARRLRIRIQRMKQQKASKLDEIKQAERGDDDASGH